jgi:hypothetical protein
MFFLLLLLVGDNDVDDDVDVGISGVDSSDIVLK